MFAFVGATQGEAWEQLVLRHGNQVEVAQRKLAQRVASEVDARGMVDVLRRGVKDHGVDIKLAFFAPANDLTPDLRRKYEANRLRVTRQSHIRRPTRGIRWMCSWGEWGADGDSGVEENGGPDGEGCRGWVPPDWNR